MDENFIRDRITQLRIRKGVSEYQMSYDLGHSRGYIYNISSGKALPPMKEFLAICEYFELTPQQFFDENTQNPELIQKAISGMKQLNEDDLLMLLGFINRLLKNSDLIDSCCKVECKIWQDALVLFTACMLYCSCEVCTTSSMYHFCQFSALHRGEQKWNVPPMYNQRA